MKRIYHHHLKWEDYKAGMWITTSPIEEQQLKEAIEFTGDYLKYGRAMRRVIHEWRYCVEHNLTNKDINRKAWIGHAAVCLQIGIPEYITRKAWGFLNDQQRELANKQAEIAIKQWEYEHALSLNLKKQIELFND